MRTTSKNTLIQVRVVWANQSKNFAQFNNDAMHKKIIQSHNTWGFVSNHDAMFQTVMLCFKSWCYLSNRDAMFQAMMLYFKSWCYGSNHDGKVQTVMLSFKPWCSSSKHNAEFLNMIIPTHLSSPPALVGGVCESSPPGVNPHQGVGQVS